MLTEIETKIKKNLQVTSLNVIDESHMHSTPKDLVTHIKIVLVSDDFKGISILKRHRMLYNLLNEEVKQIHSISLNLMTPIESLNLSSSTDLSKSPSCLGGYSIL